MYKFLKSFGLLLLALAFTACDVQKSANPLSPSVAGPIPGVNITTPEPVAPANAARILVSEQPITLTIANSTTNGVRPLSYLFEVATDAQFASKVFTKSDVVPGATGRTSVVLPQLESEKTYFWRALAQDGTNTGTYAAAASFSIYTPAVILAPAPQSPLSGPVNSLTPTLTFQNAGRSGPTGVIKYTIALNTNRALPGATMVGMWTIPETAGASTSFQVPVGLLSAGTTYYWAVFAADGVVGSVWSPVVEFTTPAAVAPTPGGGGGGGGGVGGGGGSAGPDGINLSQAVFHGLNVASWAPTVTVTGVEFGMGASAGVRLLFNRSEVNRRWPDVVVWPPAGHIQWTLFACVRPNGTQWHCGGMHEFWSDRRGAPREWTGAALLENAANGRNNWPANWAYDGRWGQMQSYLPRPGDEIGFFMVAGAVRPGSSDHRTVFERSNVVRVRLAATGIALPM